MTQEASEAPTTGRWDTLIGELHALREAAGKPSYDALTRRLIAQRVSDGQDEHAARIAKSSVHDAFRYGRSRINEGLVRELVGVMNGDPELVDEWVARCEQPASKWTPPPIPEEVAAPLPAPPTTHVLLIAVACIALNMLGRLFVDFFHLPLYLDMTGTAVAAIALGPWRGAAVGATTNIVGIIGSGWVSLPFALVNVVGALVWGYGVRRWRMGTTLPRFFLLNVTAAVACSLVAVPILLALYGESFRDGHDMFTQTIRESIDYFVVAVSFSNLITSTVDKLVSGFVALVVVSALPLAFRQGFPLAMAVHAAGEAARESPPR